MSKRTHLFIGGHLDGQRITVDSNFSVVESVIPPKPIVRLPHPDFDEPLRLEKELYRRSYFRVFDHAGTPRDIALFIHSKLSEEEAFGALLACYFPGAEEIAPVMAEVCRLSQDAVEIIHGPSDTAIYQAGRVVQQIAEKLTKFFFTVRCDRNPKVPENEFHP